jgi:hypothetical protein
MKENAGWEPGIHPSTTDSYGPSCALLICTQSFIKYCLNYYVACFICAIVIVDWILIFSADVIARKTMSVVNRNLVFTIQHVLGFTNWVSVSVKREKSEVLIELSAGDNKLLQNALS